MHLHKSEFMHKPHSRRTLLQGGALVSACILEPWITWAVPGKTEKFPGDVAILNVALGLELQAIAAYQAGAESKLLSGDVLAEALSFQNDHKRHRDTMIELIKWNGGTAVAPLAHYDFGTITSANDILKLAAKLEQGAEDAYLAHAAKLQSAVILNDAALILVDEVRHVTVLRQALGLSVVERPPY